VTEYVRARNADTGAEQDVPKDAMPILVASGWEEVTKKDAEAAAKAEAEKTREADQAMTEAGLAAIPEHVRAESISTQNMATAESAPATEKGKGGK
jgi:hypothetical protein